MSHLSQKFIQATFRLRQGTWRDTTCIRNKGRKRENNYNLYWAYNNQIHILNIVTRYVFLNSFDYYVQKSPNKQTQIHTKKIRLRILENLNTIKMTYNKFFLQ